MKRSKILIREIVLECCSSPIRFSNVIGKGVKKKENCFKSFLFVKFFVSLIAHLP